MSTSDQESDTKAELIIHGFMRNVMSKDQDCSDIMAIIISFYKLKLFKGSRISKLLE